MTLITDAAAWLGAELKSAGGVSVIYDREGDAAEITAVPGRVDHREFGSDIEAYGGQLADWLIVAADLILPTAGLTRPARGDTIVDNLDRKFEVLPRDDPQPYREIDQHEKILRVFAIEVDP